MNMDDVRIYSFDILYNQITREPIEAPKRFFVFVIESQWQRVQQGHYFVEGPRRLETGIEDLGIVCGFFLHIHHRINTHRHQLFVQAVRRPSRPADVIKSVEVQYFHFGFHGLDFQANFFHDLFSKLEIK